MSEHAFFTHLKSVDPVRRTGRVRKILPTSIEADGPAVPIGALCTIAAEGGTMALAQVAGVHENKVILVPFDDGLSLSSGALVEASPHRVSIPVGDSFLGRAVDAMGRAIDGQPDPVGTERVPLHSPAASPLKRETPSIPLETGIRAIDSLLTLGKGQRIGLFAASGVGKTNLLTQIVRQAEADRCVICLVGERGREVESLWSADLSREAKARSVLVAATSDQTAAMRVRACDYALALADHWRSEGHHVLFLLDSVTRLAMALREVGLAAGEPPTVRAYTPSVFAAIPKLVERCGSIKGAGSITAVMTVLCESDEADDPIAELMKSLLDGHIILSRALAERAHFPAIDVLRSISRLAPALVTPRERAVADRAIALLSSFESARLMIEAGVYVPGSDPQIDRSITVREPLTNFLRQRHDEPVASRAAHAALAAALREAN